MDITEQNKETSAFVKDNCLTELKSIKDMMKDDCIDVSIWHYKVHGLDIYDPDGNVNEMKFNSTDCRDILSLVIDGQTVFDNRNHSCWSFLDQLLIFEKGMEYAR